MKTSVLLSSASLAATASAHYVFPALIAGGTPTNDWQYVRQWTGYYSNGPVTDVTSVDIRCNVDGTNGGNTETLEVKAGDTVGFTVAPNIYHPGPLLAYMAKAPNSAAEFDGDGEVWFKIYEDGPEFGDQALTWPSDTLSQVEFTIPASLPDGDYLYRVEHIGLHSASAAGGAQFYISCGQITVTGGGSGTPGPLVAFPGAYSAEDPGLMINIYYPVPTEYTPPGPAVWSG
ncbi:lytic polysaccharide monooxygenase auxiliary activity family 9 protein [Aspergillus lucknowensis]|uniref:lytic cellulose monooxygenase (C4-dehydrogenating) n=1 Tax=Aspergillus lucknowensis TaxID=176173 RepID=A0ABR4L8F4_9EURO